jgi:hypothetical protein
MRQHSALCLGLLVVAACGKDEATVDAPPVSVEPSIAATLSPITVAPGGTVVVTVTAQNFNIIDPNTAPAPKAGEGHYHYYLDDATMYVAAWTPTVNVRTTANTAVGAHMIRLVLVTSGHVPITPTAETTVNFMVQ